jgi:hypothetical protein
MCNEVMCWVVDHDILLALRFECFLNVIEGRSNFLTGRSKFEIIGDVEFLEVLR